MPTKTTLKVLVACAAMAWSLGAAAQANSPRIDQRQANQQQRIDQGVASGELTARETHRLGHGQERVAKLEDRAKSDGAVSRAERLHLKRVQHKQSARIYRQKHDAQDRSH